MMPSTSQEEIPPPPSPPSSSQTPTQPTPHTVSTIKLPILKKGEYDIWAMKMEHYLAHTDYPIWEVIQNGDGPVSITKDISGQIKVLPPRTAEEIVARERERKARTTLLMALPEDHLAKFHKMTDAKEMWDAIKSRFGGNDESKKMQKYILKQQFEGFSVSNTEGLHKGYDRFQSLLSQLEIHGAGVSTKDANQKFLRSLPSAWSQVSLIMRTKPGVDSLNFDDLYNNLRVFESDIKGSTASSSSSPQNVAFVSENTNSTNEVSTAYCVPNLSGQNSKYEQTSSYSLLANQSSCPQLDHEDLVTIDGEGVDWTTHSEDEDYALMAYPPLPPPSPTPSPNNYFFLRTEAILSKVLRKLKAQLVALSTKDNFVSTARTSGTKSFSTARQSVNRQTVLTNAAMKVNTVKPIVNGVRPANVFNKTHSSSTRPFKKTTVLRPKFSNQKFNTAKDYPHRALKNKGIVDSGCSRHMTGNKAYLAEFQDFNGGPVAFGGSRGYITGKGGLACLIAKATNDESNKWHRRLGHVNFKNLNKLVKGNLVRGLPSKIFQNDHTCVACQKGKQHKASCKAKAVSSISQTLQLLHMDLFGPTSVRSLNHKTYCLVITDDFSRFSWVFFLRTKDETSAILKDFIRQIENQLNQKVKTIRSDNGTEFKNKEVIEFCGLKGIQRRDYNEGFLVGYSLQSKAFRVYNLETKRVEENLHITFLENKPNVAGKGPSWLFDLDYLTDSMNYHPVSLENQANLHAGQQEANQNAGTKDVIEVGDSDKEDDSAQDCFVLPIWPSYSSTNTPALTTDHKRAGPREEEQVFMDDLERLKKQEKEAYDEAEGLTLADPTHSEEDDSEIPPLEDIYQSSTDGIFTTSSFDDEGDPNSASTQQDASQLQVLELMLLLAMFKSKREQTTRTFIIFEIQKVWVLVDLPYGKKAIGTNWVYRNKKDERGVVVRNIARLVAHGHRKEERIGYDKVFAPMARLEAIRIFLAFASYMGFIVYQMDVKSAFLYGKIDEENGYRRGTIDKTLFLKKDKIDIILVQVYVDDIIFGSIYKEILPPFPLNPWKKFDFASVKTASYPNCAHEAFSQGCGANASVLVQVSGHYKKTSHLSAVKRIFRYLKGKPKLGLWYPKVYSFDLESYSDSDYAGANLDRKSTTGGCQFLGRRLIYYNEEARTIVATSTTERNIVCCSKLQWASFVDSKNQMFRLWDSTSEHKDYIDNESHHLNCKRIQYIITKQRLAIRPIS
ncbi:putative ribonuclease H-like domain-containing protein [Tanacetum coccineum]|uniref:Ribonuclease H-like domain-containing protein n=1 Tax=Tanacetum coccineum TaxID=301880 RepID=A0ABQ4Z0X3_9ASTR